MKQNYGAIDEKLLEKGECECTGEFDPFEKGNNFFNFSEEGKVILFLISYCLLCCANVTFGDLLFKRNDLVCTFFGWISWSTYLVYTFNLIRFSITEMISSKEATYDEAMFNILIIGYICFGVGIIVLPIDIYLYYY